MAHGQRCTQCAAGEYSLHLPARPAGRCVGSNSIARSPLPARLTFMSLHDTFARRSHCSSAASRPHLVHRSSTNPAPHDPLIDRYSLPLVVYVPLSWAPRRGVVEWNAPRHHSRGLLPYEMFTPECAQNRCGAAVDSQCIASPVPECSERGAPRCRKRGRGAMHHQRFPSTRSIVRRNIPVVAHGNRVRGVARIPGGAPLRPAGGDGVAPGGTSHRWRGRTVCALGLAAAHVRCLHGGDPVAAHDRGMPSAGYRRHTTTQRYIHQGTNYPRAKSNAQIFRCAWLSVHAPANNSFGRVDEMQATWF